MKKSTSLLALSFVLVSASAVGIASCAGGESTNIGGSGGNSGGGTGGFTSTSTGGRTGSGGITGGGSGGITGGGTGGGAVLGGMDNASAMNGYVSNGTWMGYAGTGTYGTATVSPQCDTAGTLPCFKTAGKQICASGSVGVEAALGPSNGATLGFNIAQAMLPPNPAAGLAVSSTGLSLTLSAPVKGGRIYLMSGTGGSVQYCYQATPVGTDLPTTNMIPWTMFNTTCYNVAMGTYFAPGSSVYSIGVVVPGNTTAAVPFNFCIVDAHQY